LATTWKNRLACSRASGRSPISSDLVDDQQLVDTDCAVDRRFPAALPLCRLERHHRIGRRGEAHLVPVLAGDIAAGLRHLGGALDELRETKHTGHLTAFLGAIRRSLRSCWANG
jgi:hypothetical protein